MYKVVFDTRTTHKTGIYRYATSLLQALQTQLHHTDMFIYVLATKGQEQGRDFCHSSHFRFVEVPDDYQFVQDSVWLRHWFLSEHIDLYVPSLDEGFCLPALEALACHTEVIVPDITVLRETAGTVGHYYEVDNQNQLMRYLIKAFNGTLAQKALLFHNRFSWNLSAHKMLVLFNQLLSQSETVHGGPV